MRFVGRGTDEPVSRLTGEHVSGGTTVLELLRLYRIVVGFGHPADRYTRMSQKPPESELWEDMVQAVIQVLVHKSDGVGFVRLLAAVRDGMEWETHTVQLATGICKLSRGLGCTTAMSWKVDILETQTEESQDWTVSGQQEYLAGVRFFSMLLEPLGKSPYWHLAGHSVAMCQFGHKPLLRTQP